MSDDLAEVRELFRGGSLLLIGLVFELGISFLVKVILARYLGRVDFGIVSIGMTLMTIVATVVLVGLHTGVGRYLPRTDSPRERNGIIISALQIIVPLSLAATALLVYFSGPLAEALLKDRTLRWVIIAFAIGVPFNTAVRFAVGTIQGSKTVLPKIYLQNIGLPGVRLLLLGGAVLLGLELIGVVAATVGAYVFVSIYGLWFIIRILSTIRTTGYKRYHRNLLSFSFPLLITSAMLLIFSEIDTLMLGYFDLPGAVGYYKAVYPLAMLLLVVLRAFRFLFMPQISELHADGNIDQMAESYAAVTRWTFIATMPVFIFLLSFPEQIISGLFGPEYAGGKLALIVLCLGFVTHTAVGPNGTTLTSIGRTRTIMYDNIAVATINVALNLLLIPRYSILGAAVATAIAYVSINLMYSIQLNRALDILPFPRDALQLYLFCLTVTVGVLWTWITSHPMVRVVLFGGFLLGFPYATLRFGGIGERELDILDDVGDRLGFRTERVRTIVERVISR